MYSNFMAKQGKSTITITIPRHLKIPSKKYMEQIGMTYSGWFSDRLHKEMQERNNKKPY